MLASLKNCCWLASRTIEVIVYWVGMPFGDALTSYSTLLTLSKRASICYIR